MALTQIVIGLCVYSEMLADGQATRRFSPVRDIWLPLDLSNPASFYGLLAHSAAHLAHLYGERDSAEPLRYNAQAVSILNLWVNDPDRALSDDTFAAVLRLLIFEVGPFCSHNFKHSGLILESSELNSIPS